MTTNTGKITRPEYKLKGFHCPCCGVYSAQSWSDDGQFYFSDDDDTRESKLYIEIAQCVYCEDQSVWVDGEMVIPDSGQMVPPNEDMTKEIQDDYLEAASILQKSPRAAAALLRLALQKLCVQLGGKGQNIQQDIDTLSQNGLSSTVIKAMDAVRIIGNEAVHPGQIDMKDDVKTATALFELVNFVAEKTLTDIKKINEIYDSLPVSKRRKNNSEQPSS